MCKQAVGFPVALTLILTVFSPGFAAERPNVVVILSDDMGFSDLGCYGGEVQTPTLDKLAANGLRFTQFYNTARCCPTRASLLTGLYPHQAGVGHMMQDQKLDGYKGDLNKSCVTIAEALKPAGYRSYAVGKWHVTPHTKPDGPKHNWPLQRGFDRYYGTITGAGSFWDPSTLVRDNTMISAFDDTDYKPETFYYTDAISDHAMKFVADHKKDHGDKPFFMYVAYTAAHWPMHAREEDIAKYKGKYDAGYDAIRKARFERMKKLGVISKDLTMTPTVGDWEGVKNKDWEIRCMEVYAAMIDRMDQGIGRLVAQLEKDGQLDNTLILFLQDNGGCAEATGRTGEKARADKPSLSVMKADDLQPGITPKQTRDGWPVLAGPVVMPGPADTYIAYGRNWANVSNTPFREYKHWVHEGGISTPLIAHWPKGIKAKGKLRHPPGHLIDIMATCVDVGGAKYPAEHNGEKITPLEGKSLLPAFDDKPIDRDAIFWEHEGNRAVRVGKWKLVAKGPAGAWELYDIDADRTESRDLAGKEPERVKEMTAKWEAWAKRAKAMPWPWKPEYGASPEKKEKPDQSMVPGVVIDHIAASTKQYVGSPSIAVLPDGDYVASHDVFGPGSTKDRTLIFGSSDQGKTWSKRAEIEGQWWSSLFVHRGWLMIMGTSKEYGHVVIRRSGDGGQTWGVPLDRDTGLLLGDGKYHCAPVPVLVHNGRIWRAMEDAMGPGGWGSHFRSFMMSCPLEADVMRAENWTVSNRLERNPEWLGGKFGGWLEGNAVATPDGKVVNVLRADYSAGEEKAAVVQISDDGKTASFDPEKGFINFPGGCKKFTIRHDPVSKRYWSLSNSVPEKERGPNPERQRNNLALICSTDLKSWEVRSVVLSHPDAAKHAFQYADWLFDGDDIICVCRTAHDDGLGGAHNQHDANFLTFHRIIGFRTLNTMP